MKLRLSFLCFLVFALSLSSRSQVDVKVIQQDITQCDTAGWLAMPITLINTGTVQIVNGADIMSSFKINNGSIVSEILTINSTFNPGDTITLTFITPYHFNQFATYNCMFAIDYLADINSMNDTVHFTSTFWSLPGYGNHSNDTSVCYGSPATLMMELLGNGPWMLDIVMGADTLWGMMIPDSVISAELTLDSTTVFTLINVSDSNGCLAHIGQSITITIGYPFTLDIGHDTTMCAGKTILIDAGHPGASYIWWDGFAGQVYTADTSKWGGLLGQQELWVEVNDKGCIDSDSLKINWVICPDGIAENLNDMVGIYPNPTTGKLTLTFEQTLGDGILQVENSLGQIIHSEPYPAFTASKTIDLSRFNAGLYIVSLINGTGSVRKKVLLER